MSLLSTGRSWSLQGVRHLYGTPAAKEKDNDRIHYPLPEVCCFRNGCDQAVARSEDTPSMPFYDGKDVCSQRCLQLLLSTEIQWLVQKNVKSSDSYSHRMPLGLLMLQRKWITADQLSLALLKQRQERHGRLGEWLIAIDATDEETVAKAIAVQWGVPLLMQKEVTERAQHLVPRLIVDAFDIVPVRITSNRVLYVGINERVDRCLYLALEKMTGLRVEPVVMATSTFHKLRDAALQNRHDAARMFRASTVNELCVSISEIINESSSINIQLAVVKEYIWLRILRRGSVAATKTRREDINIENSFFTFGV